MRVGSENRQGIGLSHHLTRDVGMRVQAGHDWHTLADHLSHTPQDFALTVIEMLAHHGAMQVQVNAIDRPGFRQ